MINKFYMDMEHSIYLNVPEHLVHVVESVKCEGRMSVNGELAIH